MVLIWGYNVPKFLKRKASVRSFSRLQEFWLNVLSAKDIIIHGLSTSAYIPRLYHIAGYMFFVVVVCCRTLFYSS